MGAATFGRSVAGMLARTVLAGLLALLAAGAFAPQPAQAYLSDVAQQQDEPELEESGTVVEVAAIPDGEYKLAAQAGLSGVELADVVLTVKEGQAAVSFTLAESYTYLYLGSAAQAAKAAGNDGTEVDEYLAGTATDGGLRYTFAITQLNVAVDVALYDGGTAEDEDACWHDCPLLFAASEEVNLAVAAATLGSAEEEDACWHDCPLLFTASEEVNLAVAAATLDASGEEDAGGDEADADEEEAADDAAATGGSGAAAQEETPDTSDVNLTVDGSVTVKEQDVESIIAEVEADAAASAADDAAADDADDGDASSADEGAQAEQDGAILLTIKSLGLDDSVDISALPVASSAADGTQGEGLPAVALAALALLLAGIIARLATFGAAGGFARRRPASAHS